ncbi:MAG: hypothetical protein ACLQBK_24335 [Candidatus Sulfotelmatobacter sp.]
MTRINAFRKITESSVAWGNLSALVFAAVLIVCSLTVGCSSEKPKPVRSNNQIPVTQAQIPVASMPAPPLPAENKPAARKVVHKKPATVNYTDKTYGVTFEYSRRYAIETGNAAADLLTASPIPMNFVQPGGVALAAVELPETGFVNTDFSSAFFNVSVNKALTADQCNQFAVPQSKVVTAAAAPAETPAPATASPEVLPASAQSASTATSATSDQASAAKANETAPASSAEPVSNPKLILGDLELSATETVAGEGARQSDSKYFHAFQNGACYEFALNVTTVASEDGLIKHVDRDKVFDRLEKILATVKINPVTADATAEAPAAPTATGTPAQ